LSTAEAEYTGLSYALRETIPIMDLLKEIKQKGRNVSNDSEKVHIKVYEDKAGQLKLQKR